MLISDLWFLVFLFYFAWALMTHLQYTKAHLPLCIPTVLDKVCMKSWNECFYTFFPLLTLGNWPFFLLFWKKMPRQISISFPIIY